MENFSSNTSLHWLTLIFLASIWGSSFILMKLGLKSFNSFHVAGFRVVISSIALLPYGIKGLRKVNRKNYRSFLIAGIIGIAIPSFLFTAAQTRISSSVAGMLNSLTPLTTLIIGAIFYSTRMSRKHIAGVIIGLNGAILILIFSNSSKNFNIEWHALLIIIATICYGINTNEVKNKLRHFSGLEITSVSLILSSPPILIYLIFSDYSYVNQSDDLLISILAIAGLALLGTTLALVIFNTLIKHTTALFASSVTYIIPAFAIFWGIIDNEHISLHAFIGIILVLFGVYLINKKV